MAKTVKKKVSKIKTKKKIWYKIIAPNIFGSKEMGESYLASVDKAVGRTLKVNLRELTGNVRDQNVYISFRINRVDGSALQTSTIGYELTSAYMKRAVRKNTAKLDDYFILKTKDGKRVILKSLMISLHKTQRSTRSQLRKELGVLLDEEIGKTDFAAFVVNLVNHKVQMTIKKKLSKIYPLKEVAVRVLKLKDEKGGENINIVSKEKTPEKSQLLEESEPEAELKKAVKSKEIVKPKEKSESDKEIVDEES